MTVAAIIGVMVAARIGWALIARYRRGLTADEDMSGSGWTLDDLRHMKETGQISEQEYRVLRQQAIDEAAGPR